MYRFILSIILLSSTVKAQNHKQLILAACKNYAGLKNYSMTLKYKLYVDGNLAKPFQTRDIEIKRMGNNVCMHNSNGLEVIDNDNFQVSVNNKTKVLSATKKNAGPDQEALRKEYASYLDENIDSLLLIYDKVNVLEQSKEKVKYEMFYKKNEGVEKVIVVINKKQNMYENMTVFYKKPIKVKQLDGKPHKITLNVTYADFKKNCNSNKDVFSEKKYISLNKNNKIEVLKKYSTYKLIITDEE